MVRAHFSTRGSCPDAAELAGFFEATLPQSQRLAIVSHAATCPECRATLGALGKMSESHVPVVPRELYEAAGNPPSRHHLRPVAAALAAAACVLFAVSVARQVPEQTSSAISTPAVATSPERPDDVRARTPGETPQLMEPKVGATVAASTRFEWTPVAGAVQYQLHVLTGDGDVVFDATTVATTIEYRGADARQGPFYAWVSAHLTDGRRVQSPVVRLAGSAR